MSAVTSSHSGSRYIVPMVTSCSVAALLANASLDERQVHIVVSKQQLQVLSGTGRRPQFDLDALTRQHLRETFAILVISAARFARRHDDAFGRGRSDELVGKHQAGNEYCDGEQPGACEVEDLLSQSAWPFALGLAHSCCSPRGLRPQMSQTPAI